MQILVSRVEERFQCVPDSIREVVSECNKLLNYTEPYMSRQNSSYRRSFIAWGRDLQMCGYRHPQSKLQKQDHGCRVADHGSHSDSFVVVFGTAVATKRSSSPDRISSILQKKLHTRDDRRGWYIAEVCSYGHLEVPAYQARSVELFLPRPRCCHIGLRRILNDDQ